LPSRGAAEQISRKIVYNGGMRFSRLAGALLLASMAGFFACNVYNDSLLGGSDHVPVNPSQYGSGVGWWSYKSKKTGCVSAGVPTAADAPKNADGPSIPPIILALRSMALGSLDRKGNPGTDNNPPWMSLGFDLDGMCTNSDTCSTTGDIPQPCKPRSATIPKDGHDCRDNTFGRLEETTVSLPSISEKYGLSNPGFNCALCRGDYNFLIRISQWDGQPNDSQVRVDMYPSPGLETPPPWQCQKDDPNQTWKTQQCWWQAGGSWTIQPETYQGTVAKDGSLPDADLNDPAAYVRDGYIIAQLPDNVLFWFPGDNGVTRAYPLKMQGGVVAGKLQKDKSGHWEITDGTIAGRSSIEDLKSGFEELGLCPNTVGSDYTLMTGYVSQFADILANGKISPQAQCDALSVGIGFDAAEATFGGTVRKVTPLPGCPPDTDGGVDAGDGGVEGGGGSGGAGGAGGTGGTGGAGGTSGAGGADAGLDGAAGFSSCSDPYGEPNNSPASASALASVTCSGSKNTAGVIGDFADLDWYRYTISTTLCTNPTLTASTNDSSLKVCVIPSCGNGNTNFQCLGGTQTTVGKLSGCCATGAPVLARLTCLTGKPGPTDVLVESPGGNPVCSKYTLSYGAQ
jgi:hypothetical protein